MLAFVRKSCVNRAHNMSDRKKRINVALKPEVWRKGKILAKKESRSFSNQVETLIERECERVKKEAV